MTKEREVEPERGEGVRRRRREGRGEREEVLI
jgi:hypothetical protein